MTDTLQTVMEPRDAPNVLWRCSNCNAALLTDCGEFFRVGFGGMRLFKDTMKLVGNCRRCEKTHILSAQQQVISTVVLQVEKCVILERVSGVPK